MFPFVPWSAGTVRLTELASFGYPPKEAAHPVHFDVEEHQVWQVLPKKIECLFATLRFQRPVALIMKYGADNLPAPWVVVYEKNAGVEIRTLHPFDPALL